MAFFLLTYLPHTVSREASSEQEPAHRLKRLQMAYGSRVRCMHGVWLTVCVVVCVDVCVGVWGVCAVTGVCGLCVRGVWWRYDGRERSVRHHVLQVMIRSLT